MQLTWSGISKFNTFWIILILNKIKISPGRRGFPHNHPIRCIFIMMAFSLLYMICVTYQWLIDTLYSDKIEIKGMLICLLHWNSMGNLSNLSPQPVLEGYATVFFWVWRKTVYPYYIAKKGTFNSIKTCVFQNYKSTPDDFNYENLMPPWTYLFTN